MPRRRLTRSLVLLGVVLLLLGALATVTLTRSSDAPAVGERPLTIDVKDGPARDQPVAIDATLFTPAVTPAPAVLLAHGFGGTKDSMAAQARSLAQDGFVVLTFSARGFGKTTGQIAINSPDYEIADARALVDYLAKQPQVSLDGPGDPRVGVAGASYGGALALSLAGTDKRIDAVAAAITWNDLGQALLPDLASPQTGSANTPAAGATGPDGVLKRSWSGIFFGAGSTGAAAGPCGKFIAQVCAGYLAASQSGSPSPGLLDLLRKNSPATTNDKVTAPTLLLQGQQDTLFGLDQSDANARQISTAGGPVLTSWFAGGHDTGGATADADAQTQRFLDFHLAGRGSDPGTGFNYQLTGSLGADGNVATRTVTASAYPGLHNDPTPTQRVPITGAAQPVSRPAGGAPSSISTLPGLGSAFAGLAAAGVSASALSGAAALDVPGQAATFRSDTLSSPVTITGSSRVRITVAGLGDTSEAVLFAKLYDVGPDGKRTLPGGGVSAFRIPELPAEGASTTVTVTLPGIVASIPAGHHLELAVATTDQAYATPLTPAAYTIGLAPDSAALTVPAIAGKSSTASTVPLLPLVGIGVIVLGLLAVAGLTRVRRRRAKPGDRELSDVPLVVSGLAKSYADGYRAVDGVDFTVEHGQVLGLLGPNGAGKTTVLRMLMGLISPSDGEIRVFGQRITAGSPVLSRLGSFVEGSGFVPHLSGADNLSMYWAATGRPSADAHMREALDIAGLGAAVDRKVKSYSQGMRQRLAIAQAMLGLPELLVLDEPTNGLDPPQIMAMRAVLRDYAATGRAVLVSSHLLSEVEQTCSHVVVMHKGKVVAAGTVAEIVSADGRVVLRVDSADRAVEVLRALPGVGTITISETEDGTGSAQVQADLERVPAAEAVRSLVGAGVAVSALSPRNRLEDVFLALVEKPDRKGAKDE